jgi:phage-related tail protein
MAKGDSFNSEQFQSDPLARLQDLEEKQRILKERVLIMGKNLVEEREKTFQDIKEMKKIITTLSEENKSMKRLIENMVEQINKTARKEELMILQRQFDLFRRD